MLTLDSYVWYAVVAFGVLALGCACLTVDYGHALTDEVSRKMHGKSVGVVEDRTAAEAAHPKHDV